MKVSINEERPLVKLAGIPAGCCFTYNGGVYIVTDFPSGVGKVLTVNLKTGVGIISDDGIKVTGVVVEATASYQK